MLTHVNKMEFNGTQHDTTECYIFNKHLRFGTKHRFGIIFVLFTYCILIYVSTWLTHTFIFIRIRFMWKDLLILCHGNDGIRCYVYHSTLLLSWCVREWVYIHFGFKWAIVEQDIKGAWSFEIIHSNVRSFVCCCRCFFLLFGVSFEAISERRKNRILCPSRAF